MPLGLADGFDIQGKNILPVLYPILELSMGKSGTPQKPVVMHFFPQS
jgi:hypothetical protein